MKRKNKNDRKSSFNFYFLYLASLALIVVGALLYLANDKPKNQMTLVISECIGSQAQDLKCWRDYYKQTVIQESPKTALRDAKKRSDENAFIKNNCHEIAHIIGRAAGRKYAGIEEAYSLGTDFCASGYYHGVMQAAVDKVGKDKILSKINHICEPLAKTARYGLSYYNCVHGLGHGVMSIEGNELFLSLKDCDGLEGEWERDSCYSGVFMENFIGEIDPDHYTKYLKKDDPLYPCTVVEEKYKKMCYFLQTDHALIVEGSDFDKVFNLCAGLNSELYSNMCYQSLGRNASSYAKYDVDRTRDYCALGDSIAAQNNCYFASSTDFAWTTHNKKKADALCAYIQEGNLLNTCYQAVERYTKLDS